MNQILIRIIAMMLLNRKNNCLFFNIFYGKLDKSDTKAIFILLECVFLLINLC